MTAAIEAAVKDASLHKPEPPRPLRRELPPAEPFPVAALGPVLAPAARAIQKVIQAPAAICAQSVLAAATLAVQAHADVMLPFGQVRPLSEYFVSIAASGERKTSADGEGLQPVREFEDDLRRAYGLKLDAYENARAAWEAQRRQVLNGRKEYPDTDSKRRALNEIGPPPAKPLVPMLTCSEPTLEGLIRLFNEGHPALGLFSGEGGQFLGGYGMSSDHRLKTAAALSSLWDGEPLRRVRAGDGSSVLPGRRLTTHLMVQPTVPPELLADPLLQGQGLLSCMLVTWPETTMGTRLERDPAGDARRALERYTARLRAILDADLPLRDGTTNELAPRVLELSPTAQEMWTAFADHVEVQLAPGGAFDAVRAFASKAAEHAGRLGAGLTLVDDLNAPLLDDEHLAAGIEVVQFYLSEALRLEDAGAAQPDLVRAERLREWLNTTWKHDVIGLTEIYQLGPRSLRDAGSAREAMAVVEDHGWVQRLEGGTTVGETFRREAWHIVKEEGPA